MRCEEIMKKNAECVSPIDTVQTAARKMRDGNLGFLPVCDDDGRVLGTLTDRDIAVRLVAGAKDGSTAVQEVMTREVVSVEADASLEQALERMRENHKSRILVCDDQGKLAGVISLSDIALVAEEETAGALRDISEREART